LESLTEWAIWGGYEVFQGFLGSIWIGMMLMFIMMRALAMLMVVMVTMTMRYMLMLMIGFTMVT
jgi:hypothetical protein